MGLLGRIGLFMLGLGVLFQAIVSFVYTLIITGQMSDDKIGKGKPPGSYEDDTKWDFDEY